MPFPLSLRGKQTIHVFFGQTIPKYILLVRLLYNNQLMLTCKSEKPTNTGSFHETMKIRRKRSELKKRQQKHTFESIKQVMLGKGAKKGETVRKTSGEGKNRKIYLQHFNHLGNRFRKREEINFILRVFSLFRYKSATSESSLRFDFLFCFFHFRLRTLN